MPESPAADENTTPMPTSEVLAARLPSTVLAFRGYNVVNLGRTVELLEHPRYCPIMEEYLARGSRLCGMVLEYDVDLVQRVRDRRETSLATYGEAITLVVAVSLAQLAILRECHQIDWPRAQFSFGYSLGELTAVVAGGAISMEEALRVPLEMSASCVDLARDVTLAVLFSRRSEISPPRVAQLCEQVNEEGAGVIGISSVLSPNSLILLGQGDTLDRFSRKMQDLASERLYLRRNEHRWPPLHTPIVWQRQVSCRSRQRLHQVSVTGQVPHPPVFSLVNGALGYQQQDLRSLFGDWIDHPQQLWTAVEYCLTKGATDILHVGPEANIIPATFDRLAQNVQTQLRSSGRLRALSQMANRPWLQRLLPRKAALLRAPQIRQLNLEDWLLANRL